MPEQKSRLSVDEIGVESRPIKSDDLREDGKAIKSEVHTEDHRMRRYLIIALTITSSIWLVFTAIVIVFLAWGLWGFSLSDPVTIAFLTQSLGTVLGLWSIGLKYYFSIKK